MDPLDRRREHGAKHQALCSEVARLKAELASLRAASLARRHTELNKPSGTDFAKVSRESQNWSRTERDYQARIALALSEIQALSASRAKAGPSVVRAAADDATLELHEAFELVKALPAVDSRKAAILEHLSRLGVRLREIRTASP